MNVGEQDIRLLIFTLLFQVLCILLRRNAKLLLELADKSGRVREACLQSHIRDGTVVLAKHRKRVVNTNAADIVGDRHMDMSAEKSGQVIRTDMDLLCQLGHGNILVPAAVDKLQYLCDTIHRGAGQMFSSVAFFSVEILLQKLKKLHDSSVQYLLWRSVEVQRDDPGKQTAQLITDCLR